MNRWQMFGTVMVIVILIMVGLIAYKYATGDYKCVVQWKNNTIEEVFCRNLDCDKIGCIECADYGGTKRCDCTLDAPTSDGSCWG